MLYIILFLLKIIGTILLILLGILLSVFLTLMFVPIRYRIIAEHGETIRAEGRISWLLHVLFIRFTYFDEKFQLKLRVFGFPIYDSLRPKKKKSVKKYKKHKQKKKKPVAAVNKKVRTTSINIKDSNVEIINNETELPKLFGNHPNNINQNLYNSIKEENVDKPTNDLLEEESANKKKKFSISRLLAKLKNFKNRFIHMIKDLNAKRLNLFDKITKLKEKSELILDFIHNEMNREGFRIIFSSLKKLLKHILPGKLKSQIIFGTGDPCSTGQVLGAFGIIYSLYGDKVRITPDFINSRFEGKHDARGRIRLVTLLIIVIKLIIDKRFKELKRNFILLKEAL
ncbi:MAG: DUF2953 domain-containing protein [Herbinix sp.]|nr:DUF2953 domain-containing protein [Herbinix sp.]